MDHCTFKNNYVDVVFTPRPGAELISGKRAEWQAKREQRSEKREQMREEHQAQRAQIEKACQGKRTGERVSIQLNNRVIEGSCEIRFTPDQSQFKRQTNATT